MSKTVYVVQWGHEGVWHDGEEFEDLEDAQHEYEESTEINLDARLIARTEVTIRRSQRSIDGRGLYEDD